VLMIRPMQKKVLEQVVQLPKEAPMLAEGEVAAVAVPALPVPISSTRALREQVGQQVAAEPAKSAKLLQAWLREEAR
jgi:hypothetical protein